MTQFNAQHSLAELGSFFSRAASPSAVKAPQWLAFNSELAEQLQLPSDVLANDAGLAIWSGNAVAEWAHPIAHAYAGHQFGSLVPQLGDGRAMLLAEAVDSAGKHWDIQLKGAGRTEFSRGGDGRSAIGPVIREYLLSEAMYALGVPTTRALAAVASGELVYREQGGVPGGIFTRVASSHLRVGSFQFASLHGGSEKVRQLADYAIARHFSGINSPELNTNSLEPDTNSPELNTNSLEPDTNSPEPNTATPEGTDKTASSQRYCAFLTAVAERQAALINHWLRVGFIHGVMNTDNTSICGETIDYGPAAFLDTYHSHKKFSAIDRQGRYAFSQQAAIGQWNLARLAECFLPLLQPKEQAVALATQVLANYSQHSEALWLATMAAKLGIEQPEAEDDNLIQDFLVLLQQHEIDYTHAFWQLANELDGSSASSGPKAATATLFAEPNEYLQWRQRYLQRLAANSRPIAATIARMQEVNPALIPRNHRIIEAITAVEERGSLERFYQLLNAWQTPYKMPSTELELELYEAPAANEQVQRTFCGT
ncbi:protein adenylyltransferase SelO [Aliidiomarina sp.]|uniref:protein adenylyltransferase SelO n=1 Tax=Aliidiomarina sp. TaxID=1872439 RepID=UPI003A4DD73A